MTFVDVAGAPDPEAEAERVAREAATSPFDLARGPLLRVRLVRLGERDALLCVVMDHIVADGMSLGILWREIEALYRRASGPGLPSPLPPPQKQFAACVEAQRRWMETPAFARQLGYWRDASLGAAACDLPADRPRPPVRSYRGGFVRRPVPRALAARLRALAARDRRLALRRPPRRRSTSLLARYLRPARRGASWSPSPAASASTRAR